MSLVWGRTRWRQVVIPSFFASGGSSSFVFAARKKSSRVRLQWHDQARAAAPSVVYCLALNVFPVQCIKHPLTFNFYPKHALGPPHLCEPHAGTRRPSRSSMLAAGFLRAATWLLQASPELSAVRGTEF